MTWLSMLQLGALCLLALFGAAQADHQDACAPTAPALVCDD